MVFLWSTTTETLHLFYQLRPHFFTTMRGDSLGVHPLPGVLDAVRTYLSTTYRKVVFAVDLRTHCTEVMQMAKQQGSHSCGFYVLTIMARLCGGWSIADESPRACYNSFDVRTTEKLRRAVSERLLRLLMNYSDDLEDGDDMEVPIREILSKVDANQPESHLEVIDGYRATYDIFFDAQGVQRNTGPICFNGSDDEEVGDPGIFSMKDTEEGKFDKPVLNGHEIATKDRWSFRRVVDAHTLFSDRRLFPTDDASGRERLVTHSDSSDRSETDTEWDNLRTAVGASGQTADTEESDDD